MTGQEIIDLGRIMSGGADDSQLPDASAVSFMNIGYHKVKREIIKLKNDYFWDIFKVDTTVIGQEEYEIPQTNSKDLSKILRISVKYSDNSDFIPLEKKSQYELGRDFEYYKNTQTETDPFFFIADNSYFIYPAPKNAVVDGIKVYGIKDLPNIDENSVETDIFNGKIPEDYHYIISLYISYMYYMGRGSDFKNDKISAKKDFDIALEEIGDGLGQRDMSILLKKAP